MLNFTLFSMSDPGTTYRTREEVQRMRSTQDPIRGLQRYIEDWGLATEQELKQFDKEAKAEVDAAVAEAKESPEPLTVDLWSDIYYKDTAPSFMRGREREEVSFCSFSFSALADNVTFPCRSTTIDISPIVSAAL
jgi:pyruvate dehydrogenase E1 component alpha subunit